LRAVSDEITNVVIAGLGGQGILKSSDILSASALLEGLDVKKSELHGMSQRGGSVSSDVRFGEKVLSPMVPPGEADYLLVLTDDQVEVVRHRLADDGTLITPDILDEGELPRRRTLNVAMLGVLSTYLSISEESWMEAMHDNLPEKYHEMNEEAFRLGRACAKL